ncbi:MAG: hypothetical protein ACYCTI_06195 [Acidimicrobiales bacterium]
MRKSRALATIKTTCPTCGDVELTPGQVQVLISLEDHRSSYAFRCPGCHVTVTKPADERVVRILISSGVGVRPWRLPGELSEEHRGGPITWDELLEFHTDLQGEHGSEMALLELHQTRR